MSYDLETIKNELNGRWIVTIESCTGGMLAAAITDMPGASTCFHHGYVTYANAAKVQLGVKTDLLATKGAVSAEVALAMAEAGLESMRAIPVPEVAGDQSGPVTDQLPIERRCFAIAITGIAGPGGGTEVKPVGLVYIAINQEVREFRFKGDRDAIRRQSVDAALGWLQTLL